MEHFLYTKAYAQSLLAEAIQEQEAYTTETYHGMIIQKNLLFKNRLVLKVVEKVNRECKEKGIPCRVKANY